MTRTAFHATAEAKANASIAQRAYRAQLQVEGLSPMRLTIVVGVTTYWQTHSDGWVHPKAVAAMMGRNNTSFGSWLQAFNALVEEGWLRSKRIATNASSGMALKAYAPTLKAVTLCYYGDSPGKFDALNDSGGDS
jgi:hypothetical protein